ncbi:DUF4350 domain-containing protein [Mariniflexile gromovii]|uniref:DUF4350 domain-containing protein n=1 Tax=Mariniflexile gromovii TaxID=362523 RepID=A0ABS4BXR2_9FLAO|nr:DUF4350 domain-containing protein [Mariniflexile gromovii]MBP0905375.1 DUF4350 domain-containing protein [Mariniflexile gromovii]
MDKKSKIALYAIGAVIVLMMLAEITKPKALNWRDSYTAVDKIPLGCYVLFNELKNISDKPIKISNKTAFENLKDVETDKKTVSLFINNGIHFDKQDSESLIKYVENGNSVFISTNYMYGVLSDTLNIRIGSDYNNFFKKPSLNSFTSPNLKPNERQFNDVIENSFFTSLDTLNAVALGTSKVEKTEKIINDTIPDTNINFIKVPFGNKNGAFFIHTNPFAFSNYHMLNQNEAYAATVLSFLPKHQIIWDSYYKSGRKVISSPLRFVLQNQALKWAFYIALLSLILFVIFRGKRTQRIIPVVEPLKNATVDFTRTIGDLYYQHGNFTNIITNKIQYFLEQIRTKYYLNTNELGDHFISKLAIKSSNKKEDTKALIDYIVYLKSKSNHTEADLIQLNKLIESFTKHTA